MVASVKNDKLIDTMSSHFVKSHSTSYGISSAIPHYLALPRLRGFWPFSSVDENAYIYDISGQGRVMTNVNGVSMQISFGTVPCGAFIRDSNKYFYRSDEVGLSITGTLGLATWVRFDSESTGVETGLISKWVKEGNKRSYALIKTDADVFRFQVSDDGVNDYSVDSTVTYSSGQWYFICGLFYPSTYMKIFVNGVWVEDDVGIPAEIYDSTVPFTFGSHNEGGFFDGLMTMNVLFALLVNETTQETVINSLYQHTRALFGVRS